MKLDVLIERISCTSRRLKHILITRSMIDAHCASEHRALLRPIEVKAMQDAGLVEQYGLSMAGIIYYPLHVLLGEKLSSVFSYEVK